MMRICMAGDSTMADYPDDQAPMAGWGQMLPLFLQGEVTVVNAARCGRSSRSFIAEGWLDPLLGQLAPGDVLIVGFAHNDQKQDERFTEPQTTYRVYLTRYVEGAKQRGAYPVLVTPVQRRHFNQEGQLQQTHGDYPGAIRELAAEMAVPVIDLLPLTERLYREMGPENSKELFVWLKPGEHPNYPEGLEDNTHFNEYGARCIAGLAAKEMVKLGPPLADYIHQAALVRE
ncbi:rhamnogalacturonan acetylesterase [Paenibacillus thalictri]|uniref:Rhamnogalacturonan acetylesterase n=1 Tax=Paenibacillus thalictri TaxID=2527873 RepID=A0A4Q9DJK7_9BACL|nr:rhamnogalacturonan acetylesterase [Paenibacillus thalictri]TBL70777.1 rhamnogalacturonan acetylesterase [Paenibacillus thalictri]